MAMKSGKALTIESPLAEKSLHQIAQCLAYLVLQTDGLKGKPNNELIPVLASFGFDRTDIASILQTTPGTVSVRLSRMKVKSDKKNASKDKSKAQPHISE
jgi:CRP-like cAMP-binding protein